MTRHLLKLVWNRKRKNTILMIEIIFSFIVLFVVFSIGTNYFWVYSKDNGFNSKDVYTLNLNWWNVPNIKDSSVIKSLANFKQIITSFPEVKKISFTGNNVAYSSSTWSSPYSFKNVRYQSHYFQVDSNFFSVMEMPIVTGQGFKGLQSSRKEKFVIINEILKSQIEDKASCVGQKLENERFSCKIVGTIGSYKYHNEFTDSENQVFILNDPLDTAQYLISTILIKVKKGTGAEFEQKLLSRLHQVEPAWDFYLMLMDRNKEYSNSQVMVPFILLSIVSIFLILNVAMGLFGVFWYNVNRRKPEIGLRRSLGSTSHKIGLLVIGETWMLTAVSIGLGLILVVQVPMFGLFNLSWPIYLAAIAFDILFVLGLVTLCSYYPGRIASAIQPMEALRSE